MPFVVVVKTTSKEILKLCADVWSMLLLKLEHHFGSIWQIKNNRNAHDDAPSVFIQIDVARLVSHLGLVSARFCAFISILHFFAHSFVPGSSFGCMVDTCIIPFLYVPLNGKKRTNEPLTRINCELSLFWINSPRMVSDEWISTSNKQIYYFNSPALWINIC